MKNKENKDLDQYLREMMGDFTEKELEEAAKSGFKNLQSKEDNKIPNKND